MGLIADKLRATLRELAESDSRLYRGLAEGETKVGTVTTPELKLPTVDPILAAISLLEANGYTVTK